MLRYKDKLDENLNEYVQELHNNLSINELKDVIVEFWNNNTLIDKYYASRLGELVDIDLPLYNLRKDAYGNDVSYDTTGSYSAISFVGDILFKEVFEYDTNKYSSISQAVSKEVKYMDISRGYYPYIPIVYQYSGCVIAMTAITGTSLFKLLEKNQTEDFYEYIRPKIYNILNQLSYSGVVHGDIKPDNMILDRNDNLWLIDFGLSYEGKVSTDYQIKGFNFVLEDFGLMTI